LYFMSTKFFSDGATQAYFNPYDTPYEAYINYMNVLSDFSIRVNALLPESTGDQEIANLTQVITEKEALILKYESELKRLKSTKTKILAAATPPAKAPAKTRKSALTKKEKTNSSKAGKK
jgi:alpha-amylase